MGTIEAGGPCRLARPSGGAAPADASTGRGTAARALRYDAPSLSDPRRTGKGIGLPIHRILQQGTAGWLEWRRQGLGASDAPVVMGVSPWMDLGTLWREKTGRAGARGSSYAMRRGQILEPEARALYIRTTGVRVEPVCLEHSEHGWMRGSLDGLSADGRTVLEIKCPGESDHGTAVAGRVPEKYLPQLQHLLMVSGAEVCHYFSYRHGAGTLIEVKPDPAYIRSLVERERDFWRHVLEDRCPPPGLFDG